MSDLQALLREFVVDDRGVDLVDYMLLGGVIGLAGAAAFQALTGAMQGAYNSRETHINSIWVTPDPSGGGS
jgi:Flp pilus assembly pilin Flp